MDLTILTWTFIAFFIIIMVYIICHARHVDIEKRLYEGRGSVNRIFAENGRRLSEIGLRIERQFASAYPPRSLGTEARRRSTLDSINESNEISTNNISMDVISETSEPTDPESRQRVNDVVNSKANILECQSNNMDTEGPLTDIKNNKEDIESPIKETNIQTALIKQNSKKDSNGNKESGSRKVSFSVAPSQLVRKDSVMPFLPNVKCLPRRKSVLPIINEEEQLTRRHSSKSLALGTPSQQSEAVLVKPPVYVCPRRASVIFNSDIFAKSQQRKSFSIIKEYAFTGKAKHNKDSVPKEVDATSSLPTKTENTGFWQSKFKPCARRKSNTGVYYTKRRRNSDNFCKIQEDGVSTSILSQLPANIRNILAGSSEKVKSILDEALKGKLAGASGLRRKSVVGAPRQSSTIPKTKGNYITGNLSEFKAALGPKAHEVLLAKSQSYGPLYEINALGQKMVFLFDHKDIKCLKKAEGKYPRHMDFKHLRIYRQRNNLPLGVLLSNGEEWKRQRGILSKLMQNRLNSAQYFHVINQVAKTAVKGIQNTQKYDEAYKPEDDLGNYAIEAFGRVLYGINLNCLNSKKDTVLRKFVEIAKTNFDDAKALLTLPSCLMLLHPAWRRHNERWNFLLETTIKQARESLDDPTASRGCILSKLISCDGMTEPELLVNLTDLLLASIDTTCNVLLWCLYELSKHPDCQAKIIEETRRVNNDITFESLHNMVYLKAVIKETLRLHPVGFFSSRTINKPMNVRQYKVPPKANVSTCMYVMGRNTDLFPEPEEFKPCRWLGDDNPDLDSWYRDVPFGFGPRMCLGRRIAEIEVALFLLHFCQAFDFKSPPYFQVDHHLKLLLVPSQPIEIILHKRE